MDDGLTAEEQAAVWAPLLGKSPATVIATLSCMLGAAIVRMSPDYVRAEEWHLRACCCVGDLITENWAAERGERSVARVVQ